MSKTFPPDCTCGATRRGGLVVHDADCIANLGLPLDGGKVQQERIAELEADKRLLIDDSSRLRRELHNYYDRIVTLEFKNSMLDDANKYHIDQTMMAYQRVVKLEAALKGLMDKHHGGRHPIAEWPQTLDWMRAMQNAYNVLTGKEKS